MFRRMLLGLATGCAGPEPDAGGEGGRLADGKAASAVLSPGVGVQDNGYKSVLYETFQLSLWKNAAGAGREYSFLKGAGGMPAARVRCSEEKLVQDENTCC